MSYNSFATYAKRLKEQRAQLNAVPNAQSLYYRDKVEDEEEEEKNKGGFWGGLGYFFNKIGLGFMQGIEGIVDYTVGGVSELLGAMGVEGAEEFAEDVIGTDWMNYNHADEWFNPSEGWKTAGDVAGGIGTSLPGLLTTVGLAAATGGASLAVQAAGLGVAGLSAAGTATKEAYQETGTLGGKEFGYGALSGAVEAGTEYLTGKVLGTGLTKVANATTSLLGDGAKAFAKTVGKNAAFGVAKEFASEAFEEGFSEWISPYLKRATYDPNAEKATAEEIAYAALVGGLSGVVTGGATTAVVRGKNTFSGAVASKKGETSTILDKAQLYMGEDAAAGTDFKETVEKIYKKYQDTTGDGALAKVKRARLLGELKSAEVNGAMSGMVKRSAISATQNAEAIAQRLNSDGRYKMVDGKLTFVADSKNAPTGDNVRDITAEDIRRGYDPSKKNSLDKALKDNEVLRYVAASDAAGRFMLQATEVENATLRGEQIRNETAYKRLREEASPEARAAMSRELGIDLNTASFEEFNTAVKAYKESGKADAYQAKIKKVEEIKSKKDSKAYAMPRAISLADGGIRHYTDGQSNIAIARDGESFIIYDYDSGKVSRSLSRAEVNSALAKYREGTMNEAAATSESAAEVKSENASTNENLSSASENVQNAAETTSENVQEKAESASDIWEKGVTEADRKAATEARKQAAEIDSYAKENIKDYDNLSRANKLTVRDVIRKARESGISEADALSYARVAARTGLDIQFNQKECYKGKNEAGEDVYHAGFYDPENNRIVVNPETKKKHTVLLIHELSHAMRSYRTKGGEVKYFIDEDVKVSKELWNEIKKYYSDKKGNVDMDLALDEASAYYAEALFGTEGAIDLLLGEKPTLRQKILSFFKRSEAYYSTDEKLSREARRHFKKFKAMFDSFALRNTVNNTDVAAVALSGEKTEQEEFSTANMRGEADGAVASNEVTETMVAMAKGKRFSMNTEFEALPKQTMSLSTGEGTLLYMIEGLDATEVEGLSSDKKVNGYSGRAVREFAMRNNKFNKSEISNVNKFMDEMAKFMEEAGVTYRFIGLNDVKNAKLHYTYNSKGEIKSIVLSAMVKNGDYPVNFDLSSICKKRVAMSTLIRKLAKRGSIDNGTVDLTPANIFRINRALKDAGYETACLGCFVESKRYNSLKWAETFCAKWNAAVKKINPNATYFDYGSAKFTEDSFTLEQAIKLDEAANKYIKATKTERLANALEKYKAKEAAGQPLIEGKLMKVDGKELNTFSKAARDRIVKSEVISEELKNRYLTCDVSTLNMADVEFLLENGVLPGASLSNKQAVTEMVKSGEAYQHLLKPSDLLTDQGIAKLEALPNFHGVLYGHYGSGTPKLMQSYTPYNSEIALLPTHKNSEQTLAEYLYSIAGVRMQSFSDFQIQNIYDYLQMVADLAARKLPAHAYTKEISFARLLGMTGIKVNLSVMYDIDATADSAHAGLTKLNKLIHKGEYAVVVLKDEQGEWVYNIGDYQTQKMFAEAFPDEEKRFLQSIGFADAVKLQSTEGYSANCGIIGVGYSDLAIFAMLDDKRIRYIIPYHASSLPADIKIATNIELGTDYTSYQNNMKISEILDKNGNKVAWSVKEAYKRLGSGQAVVNELNESVRSEGWVVKTTKAQKGHGSYGLYEDLQQTSDPKKTASNFLDWCAKNGTLPLFYQFASHENYYKLIYDYNVYDCITEKYAPQEAVTNTYPTMQDGSVKAGNVTDGGFNTEYLESAIDKQMAFMDNYNRNLDADLDRLADNMEKGNYSFDQPLNEKFEVGKSARRASAEFGNSNSKSSTIVRAKDTKAENAIDFIDLMRELDYHLGEGVSPAFERAIKRYGGFAHSRLYRGIDAAEFDFIVENGYIKSNSSYNFSDQQGQTRLAPSIKTAYSYATHFAPTEIRKRFFEDGAPSYIVEIANFEELGIVNEDNIESYTEKEIDKKYITRILELTYDTNSEEVRATDITIDGMNSAEGKIHGVPEFVKDKETGTILFKHQDENGVEDGKYISEKNPDMIFDFNMVKDFEGKDFDFNDYVGISGKESNLEPYVYPRREISDEDIEKTYKTSYNKDVFTATDDFYNSVPYYDRRAFSRSLAYQTSGMQEGEVKTIFIKSTSRAYAFEADGYMRGQLVRNFSQSEYEKLIDKRKELLNGIDSNRKRADLWFNTVPNNGGESGANIPLSTRGGGSITDDSFSEDTPERNGARHTERNRTNLEIEERSGEKSSEQSIKKPDSRRASAETISNTSADIEASRASIVMDMDKRYKPSKSEAVSDFFTNFQIQTTNAQAGVEKVLKKNGVKDAEAIVQMARAASNAADSMLGLEQYRIGAEKTEDKVKVGRGLSEIMKPIDNATAIEDEVKNLSKDEAEAKREEYRADFFTYLFHEHNVDRMSLRSRQIEWMKEDLVRLESEVNELEAKKKALAEALGKEKTKEGKKSIRKEIAENRKALDKATNEYAKTKVNIEAAERFVELEATKNEISEEIKGLKKKLEAEGITKDEKKAIADDLKSARNKLGDVKREMTNLKVIMSDNGFELAVDKPVIGRAVDENGNTVVSTVDDEDTDGTDEGASKPKVQPYTAEESRAIADELLKKHPEFAKSAEELWGYSRNLNQYRVDTGLITQEQFDYMQKLYPHYVPTYREGSAQGIAALKGKYDVAVKSTVKSATGSVRPLLRPDVIIARQTMETVRAGAINKLARALHDAAGNTEDVTVIEKKKVSSEEAAEIDITEVKPKNNRVIFFRDGEKIELQVTKEIFAGFDDFNSKSKDGALIGTAAWITDKYKKLVTSYSPLFIVRNMVRDLWDAGINTKYAKKFAKNYIRAIKQIATNGKYWQLYRAMGGLGSSLFDFDKGYSTTTNKKGLPTKKGMVRKFFQSIENANVFVEQLPRLAEFMSAMQSGKSAEQALLDAADVTTNFGRGGKLVKAFNRTFVPFLNPAVQGFSKIVRMITSIRSMREFSSLLFKCAILGIVPIILNQLMYGDDEDYEKLRESDKENNFLIKLPNNTFIKIPRGRVTSVLAGLYNRPAAAIKGEDVDWGDYLDNVSTQISPVDGGIPRDIFSPIRDIYSNKTWYGTDIENQSDELVAPGERYDESTSEIAKAIGGLLNVSPKKIHYLIDQYSGVLGDIVLPATSNKANRGYFLGNTTIDPTTQNKLSSSFYDAIDGVTYIKNSKSGKYTEEEMLEARAVSKYYNDVKQKISELNEKKREINNNSKLSNSEKRKQIDVIQTMINEYYKEALTDASAVANVYSTTDTLGTGDIYSNYVTSIKGEENFAETYENLRYIETIKQLYGSETALSEYNKSVYEKSQLYNALGISYDKYYDYYFTTKGIESDVDKQGNTIAGSKKTKVLKAIKRLGGSKNQQVLMLYASGYTVQDGDIKGVSAERAKTILLNAIMKLNVTKAEKVEIAKSFGFKVKNGRILKN